MIAIFYNNRACIDSMKFTPKHMFKEIHSIDDVRGVVFSGVILAPGCHEADERKIIAFESLRRRQPELFNKQ